MREIKFRAWDKEFQCRLDPEHFYITGEGRPFTCQKRWGDISCRYELMGTERYIIERYTGLKDKNGKEVYEGDILAGYKIITDSGQKNIHMVVQFKYGAFGHKWIQPCFDSDEGKWEPFYDCDEKLVLWLDEFKIVGNIYENPELLEQK